MNLYSVFLSFLIFSLLSFSNFSLAQSSDTLASFYDLKKLSLEELMNLEVTSVSKHPEKLNEVASAIQVITKDDIRRSGVKTLPEALRLASNLQVAQTNASQWGISARGFNLDNLLANKLLVLIDGRVVYTPMYAGVFWDVQNLLLEDVERIEVISGPGGTLWGANAVNGVINIITKNAKDTKGLFVEVATGTLLPGLGSLRYGGKINDKLSYRVYATGFKLASTVTSDSSAKDAWWMSQGGFRFDWEASEKDQVTLQSNAYDGRPNPDGTEYVIARGAHMLGKWNHTFSEKADFQLQLYYDHTWRDFRNNFTEKLQTYDIEFQSRYKIGGRNVLTYGLGARLMDQEMENLELFGFFPAHKELHLYNIFVQDEITLIKERLRFTLGTKVEHNSYTGFEYQPSSRIIWTPGESHTVWAAVSRAVRTPSRTDREFMVSLTPTFPVIQGDSVISEELLAYELGWRWRPFKKLSLSFSTFYNTYDNLRSAEPGPILGTYPITFANGVHGETYGAEFAMMHQPAEWLNIRGGYTFLRKNLWVKPDSKDLNDGTAESNDPEHQFLLQSTLNFPAGIELGTVLRWVDNLSKINAYVPAYFGLDVRLAWNVTKNFELSVVGQNLLDDRHVEFIRPNSTVRFIERSVYGKISCRF